MKKMVAAALVLAFLTGIFTYRFAKNLEKSASPDYTEVLVAVKPIADRTVITSDMVELRKMPSEAVLSTAISDPKQVIGLVSAGMIETGEILSMRRIHLQGSRAEQLEFYIPEGFRAVTIEVDLFAGVGGFILPGDRVDIIATMNVPEDYADSLTQHKVKSFLLAQDIEVLASGTTTKAENGIRNIVYNSVTLALEPQQALSVSLAASGGKLRLALRSGADDKIVACEPVSPDLILPKGGGGE